MLLCLPAQALDFNCQPLPYYRRLARAFTSTVEWVSQ